MFQIGRLEHVKVKMEGRKSEELIFFPGLERRTEGRMVMIWPPPAKAMRLGVGSRTEEGR